jgi:sulfotransferase family protein
VIRIIWLASYPKSGNTWLCVLIANVMAKVKSPIDINKIFIGGSAGNREILDYFTLIDSSLLTHDEIDCLRPRTYEAIARGGFHRNRDTTEPLWPIRFFKAHDAYTANPAGESLFGDSAYGAIVIVRDPRDVAPSLANHLGCSIDEAITFMNDNDAGFYRNTDRQGVQLRQKVHSWSANVASWLDQTDIPIHLVRYEDLRKAPAETLGCALAFAGLAASDQEIRRAVAFSDFAALRQQEQQKGFDQAPRPGTTFFRRGAVGSWRDELTRDQVAGVESHHARMMRRLGYDLSYATDLADAG